jgi:hypothetical protein
MEKHTLRFTREKETKNTVRFEENVAEGKPPVIGSLYVQKWAVGSEESIDVTIGPAADSATQPKKDKEKSK